MITGIYQMILVGAVLATLAILTSVVSRRVGAPSLLLFLLIGMLAGEEGLGLEFSDVDAAFLIGNLALAVILLDGGLRTHVSSFRVGLAPALSLATVGVAITSGIVGAGAAMVLDWPWTQGFLLGAIVGSTDAAAVFALLHAAGLELKQRSSATLEIESGTNDPMAIFLTIATVSLLEMGEPLSAWAMAGEFLQQMGLGIAIGVAGGFTLGWLVNRLTLPQSLYPLLVSSVGIVFFGVANLLGGSGFLAIYMIGLVVANRPLNYLHEIRNSHDSLAWMSQIGMFLIMGLLVTPSDLLDVALPGLIIAAVLIFLARPVAVLLTLIPFRFPWREQVFISWVGLKGAVPIILALFPWLSGLPNSDLYFALTFFVVLLSLCLQGWTIAPLARWLKLEVPPHIEDFKQLSLGAPGRFACELLAYKVHAGSPADAYNVDRLPLPPQASLVGVVRKGAFIPGNSSVDLKPGDELLLLTPQQDLSDLSPLFQKLPSASHLRANEFFGQFSLRGDTLLKDVANFYSVVLPADEQEQNLNTFISRRYRGRPVVGDRVRVGAVEFVVRQIMRGEIIQVGLKLRSD